MSEMSNDQVEREPEKYGSKFAQMFGYIRPEDRARWSQLRAENQKKVSTTRQTAKLSSASMLDFGNRNINAKLMAAHRVAEQEKFDTTHAKTVTQDMDPRTKQITETVDYTDLQADAEQIDVEPDFEM